MQSRPSTAHLLPPLHHYCDWTRNRGSYTEPGKIPLHTFHTHCDKPSGNITPCPASPSAPQLPPFTWALTHMLIWLKASLLSDLSDILPYTLETLHPLLRKRRLTSLTSLNIFSTLVWNLLSSKDAALPASFVPTSLISLGQEVVKLSMLFPIVPQDSLSLPPPKNTSAILKLKPLNHTTTSPSLLNSYSHSWFITLVPWRI